MKTKIVLFGLIISLGGYTSTEASADQERTVLKPVAKYSFCTIHGRGYSLAFVGNNWALQLSFASRSHPENAIAEYALFRRGPGIHKYIHRPAGPRMPDPPDTGEYSKDILSEVTIDVEKIDINPEKNFGIVEAAVNNFTVSGEVFYMSDPVKLSCRVPNP
jgi:hypothetical protein